MALLARSNGLGFFPGMHLHVQRFNFTAQHRGTAVVELNPHQPRCKLHHVRIQPELFQRVGRLQPQ